MNHRQTSSTCRWLTHQPGSMSGIWLIACVISILLGCCDFRCFVHHPSVREVRDRSPFCCITGRWCCCYPAWSGTGLIFDALPMDLAHFISAFLWMLPSTFLHVETAARASLISDVFTVGASRVIMSAIVMTAVCLRRPSPEWCCINCIMPFSHRVHRKTIMGLEVLYQTSMYRRRTLLQCHYSMTLQSRL